MHLRGQMLPAANGLSHAAEALGWATEEKLTPLSLSTLGFLWVHPCERPTAAAKRYAAWVARAPDLEIWPAVFRQKLLLEGDEFVEQMQAQMAAVRKADKDLPKRHPLAYHKRLQAWLDEAASPAQGLFNAYYTHGQSPEPVCCQDNYLNE